MLYMYKQSGFAGKSDTASTLQNCIISQYLSLIFGVEMYDRTGIYLVHIQDIILYTESFTKNRYQKMHLGRILASFKCI